MSLVLTFSTGTPRIAAEAAWGTDDPLDLAQAAIECGVRRLLILDLARVGTGRGLGTSSLLDQIRQAHPTVQLIVGGGSHELKRSSISATRAPRRFWSARRFMTGESEHANSSGSKPARFEPKC